MSVILTSRNNNIVVFEGKIFDLEKIDRLCDFLWDASESKADAMLGHEDAAMELYWEMRDLVSILKEVPNDKIQRCYVHEPRFDQEMWRY